MPRSSATVVTWRNATANTRRTFRSTVARLWRATLAQMVCSVKLGEHPRANTQVPLCNSTQVWRQLTRLETARTRALDDLLLAFCDESPANLDDSGWACDVESRPERILGEVVLSVASGLWCRGDSAPRPRLSSRPDS